MSGRALRITLDTQEILSDEAMAKIAALHEKYGWFAFMVEKPMAPEDLLNLPPLPSRPEDEKSPAVRLRNVLFRLFEQRGKEGDFETFYRQQIEKLIDAVKERLT